MMLGVSGFDLPRGIIIIATSAVTALVLVGQRGVLRRLLASHQERIRTLIYAYHVDSELFANIHSIPVGAIELVGLIYDSPWELNEGVDVPCPFVGTWHELKRVAKQTEASHVLVLGCDAESRETQRLFHQCEQFNLRCSVLLDPRRLSSTHPACTFLHELPVLQRQGFGAQAQFMQLKRIIDVVLGSCLLIVALPIGLLIAVIIKYDSEGTTFFRQQRIGKDGRPFELLKFRTMHTWAPTYHRSPASNCDPRITRVGRLLRRLSLDELPQLLNVLKGDMSLVGPRPEMPFIVDQYRDGAGARLGVRPGITGLWQISRARSLPIHHNLQYDLFYIEHQSIFLDAAILLRTLGAVIRGIGAA
jgi:exopolysaccharide biosynthesis polyprenyl glycosylphosphotransferase